MGAPEDYAFIVIGQVRFELTSAGPVAGYFLEQFVNPRVALDVSGWFCG